MKRTSRFTRVAAAGVVVVMAGALAACSSSGGKSGSSAQPGKGKPAITMGDKNFAEEYVLGELYSQALRAKGYTVDLKSNIGASDVIDKALTSGKIDMYPEYTGVIYTVLAGRNDTPKSAKDTYDVAKAFENKRGFELLNPTPFQDADGLATTKAYANKHGLKTIEDLKKVGTFSYTAPPENRKRYQGLLGLQKTYGLNKIQFIPLTAGSQYQALNQGKTDTIAIFTTDAQLASGKYAVLTDNKSIFGFQQVAPVVSKKVLAKMGPEFTKILNKVSATLTIPAVVAMNKAVQIDQKKPADVAKSFLKANKLI